MRSDAKPAEAGWRSSACPPPSSSSVGADAQVAPSSNDASTRSSVSLAAGAPGWCWTSSESSQGDPAGARPCSSTSPLARTTISGSGATGAAAPGSRNVHVTSTLVPITDQGTLRAPVLRSVYVPGLSGIGNAPAPGLGLVPSAPPSPESVVVPVRPTGGAVY